MENIKLKDDGVTLEIKPSAGDQQVYTTNLDNLNKAIDGLKARMQNETDNYERNMSDLSRQLNNILDQIDAAIALGAKTSEEINEE